MSDNNMSENELMIKHERLVYLVAHKYFGGRASDEDILQIGRLGLLAAIRSYKPDINMKLSTYATRCIYNEIATYLITINRAKRKVECQMSLDQVQSDDGKLDMYGNIADDRINVEGDICVTMLVQNYIDNLTDRDKQMMQMLIKGYSAVDIANQLGISRQRVSKVVSQHKAILKIKLGGIR